MKSTLPCVSLDEGPKQRERHYSYDENVNEPGKLIDDEPTEIEHSVPADEREPIEGEVHGPAAFED